MPALAHTIRTRVPSWIRVASLLSIAGTQLGCSLLISSPPSPRRFYVLPSSSCAEAPRRERPTFESITVAPVTADPFTQSTNLIFSKSVTTRDYYKYASWVEAPTGRLTTLLADYLECTKRAEKVNRVLGLTNSQFLLTTELRDFYHDISSSSSVSIVTVRVELISTERHRSCGAQIFTEKVEAPSLDAQGAVIGLGEAVAHVLERVDGWLSAQQCG